MTFVWVLKQNDTVRGVYEDQAEAKAEAERSVTPLMGSWGEYREWRWKRFGSTEWRYCEEGRWGHVTTRYFSVERWKVVKKKAVKKTKKKSANKKPRHKWRRKGHSSTCTKCGLRHKRLSSGGRRISRDSGTTWEQEPKVMPGCVA